MARHKKSPEIAVYCAFRASFFLLKTVYWEVSGLGFICAAEVTNFRMVVRSEDNFFVKILTPVQHFQA